MSVSPSSFTLVVDATQSLTVTARYDDNTQSVVTSGVSYQSMAPATATVSPAGLVTGVAVGSTTVTATFGGKSGTAFVTVNAVGEDTLTVFADDYGAGVGFAPFAGTTNEMTIDTSEKHSGNASLKIVVPSADFTGGALKIDFGVDVATFDAITFWAKSSKSTLLDTVGIGNDTVDVTYQAEVLGLPLTSTWTKFVVPLPLPSKLTSLTGLFHFAEGSNEGAYTIWMDDIQFEKLGGTVLGPPNPAIASDALTKVIGDTFSITGGTVTFAIGTASRTVNIKPGYLTFNSSNTDVATVDGAGLVSVVGTGSTNITARLASVDASGTVEVTVSGPVTGMSIFADDYATGVSFVAFGGSTNDLVVDDTEKHSGAASLRIGVPAAGYTGGAMKIATPADLTTFDAVTFWAKASKAATLNVSGLGNDGATAPWSAELAGVALTTAWTKYVVPIPLASKLISVGGLFHFAEGADEGAYTIWMDDIQVEHLGSSVIGAPSPAIAAVTLTKDVGDMFPVTGTAVTFPVSSVDRTVSAAPGYFTFNSSDQAVATVAGDGTVTAAGAGSATITARLGTVDASGAIMLTVSAPAGTRAVFTDDYAAGITFVAFGGSTNDLAVDPADPHSGSASLRIGVPAGGYTGGAFKSATDQDLTAFDAVTFWGKASKAATLNVTGLGNDGTSTPWSAEWHNAALTTTWTKYVVPIPLAAKLTAVGGVFHFAEGSDEGAYTIWLDDIQYEQLGSGVIGAPMPAIATETFNKQVGDTVPVNGCAVTFPVNGTNQTIVQVARSYFSFDSSDTDVATVDANGVISAVSVGSSLITASLGGVAAAGVTTINVAAATVPTIAAPTPTVPTENVISLFSGPYTNEVVEWWITDWSMADLTDLEIAGNATKRYTNLVFAGVEFFRTATINATTMTHFHLDIWTPDSTQVRVKLADFGADSLPGGTAANADSEAEVTFDGGSTPVLTTGTWMQLDIPITAFKAVNPNLKLANVAQLIISGSNSTIYVDNVYFHN